MRADTGNTKVAVKERPAKGRFASNGPSGLIGEETVASVSTAGPGPGMSADGGKVNMAFIAGIVAVATIGGFMFGYDSGVINGTQNGLKAASASWAPASMSGPS